MSQCRRHVPSFRASTSRRTSQGRAMPHGHVRFPNPWFQAYSGQTLDQIPQPRGADRPDMGVSVQTLCLHSTLRRNGLRQH